MAFSQIENSYMDMVAEAYNPTMPPEPELDQQAEPSLEGMQLAAGPSVTRTDAPQGYGSGEKATGVTLPIQQQQRELYSTGEATAVNLTNREKLASFLTESMVNLGADRYKTRERVESFIGGTSSRLPLDLGLADFVPFLGTFLQSEEAAILLGKAKQAAERGDIKTAAIEGVGGTLGLIPGAIGTAKLVKKSVTELGPTAGKMAEDYMRKTGGLMDIVPVENYMFVAADAAARVDNGAVNIINKVSKGKKLQLDPKYRVTVKGAYEPQGSGQNIPNNVNPGNIDDASFRLDNLTEAFPDPLESPEKFSAMLATVYNSTEVPLPPKWLISNANNMDKWSGWFSTMSKNQIDEADRGFAVVDKFKNIYSNKTASADTTGRLMMWAMLSRMASAYPHESGFLDLAEAMGPIINKAVRGEYTPADIKQGLKIVKQAIPQGSPGRSVISNANAFVDTFLPKMAQKLPDGRTKLQALHDMMIDPSMSGPKIRRAFYGLAEGVGIKNKVLSFALLVSGREDVMVLDRIQINRLFADGDKIYDDVAHLFDGGPGLAIYEGMERSLAPRVAELYRRVGREDKASIGRYHWESWVLSSGQEVAHPTLDTIVKSARGEADAFVGVPVMEGRTHQTVYGVTYERTPGGGNRFVYTGADGGKYQFNKNELDAMFTSVMKGNDKAVPKDFPGVKYFSKETLPNGSPNPYFGKPWYTWPGVNRERIDEAAATYGTRLDVAGGSRDLERTVQSSSANGPQRTGATEGRETSVTRGRRAPTKGAQ